MSWVIHKAKIVRPTTRMEKEASDFRCFVVGLPFSMTPDDIKMGKLRCVCRLRSTLSLFISRYRPSTFFTAAILPSIFTLQHLWRKKGKKVYFSFWDVDNCAIIIHIWKKVFFSREIANLWLKEYKISQRLVYFRENILEYYLIRQLLHSHEYSYKSVYRCTRYLFFWRKYFLGWLQTFRSMN